MISGKGVAITQLLLYPNFKLNKPSRSGYSPVERTIKMTDDSTTRKIAELEKKVAEKEAEFREVIGNEYKLELDEFVTDLLILFAETIEG